MTGADEFVVLPKCQRMIGWALVVLGMAAGVTLQASGDGIEKGRFPAAVNDLLPWWAVLLVAGAAGGLLFIAKVAELTTDTDQMKRRADGAAWTKKWSGFLLSGLAAGVLLGLSFRFGLSSTSPAGYLIFVGLLLGAFGTMAVMYFTPPAPSAPPSDCVHDDQGSLKEP